MFQNFMEENILGDGATLFVRHAGPRDAPPLVLLHGYPRTSARCPVMAAAATIAGDIK